MSIPSWLRGPIPWRAALVAPVLVSALASGAWAQWGSYVGDPLARGPGYYLAWWKMLLLWLVVLMWFAAADWISRDAEDVGPEIDISSAVWNPLVVFVFLAAFLLLGLLIPIFAVSLIVVILAYAIPLFIYIPQRNSRLVFERKVLTGAHLKRWFGDIGKREKSVVEVLLPHERGAAVVVEGASHAKELNQINTIKARTRTEAYLTAKETIAAGLDRRSERIMLDYGRDGVAIRHDIDGFWHAAEPMDRAKGDEMLGVLKVIAGVNESERRARQDGKFTADYKGQKYQGTFSSQGVQSGERVILDLRYRKPNLDTLEQLGMREKMRLQLKDLLAASQGFLVFSAPNGGGLRTTWCVAIQSTDRLLRDFYSVEDAAHPSEAVENVAVWSYNAAAGETAAAVMPRLLLKQPEVFMVPELQDADTAKMLCDQVINERRLAITRVRAKEAVEALLRILLLKAPPDQFSKCITAVVNQRLIRRLCSACKQGYEAPADLLRKLGIPAGKVTTLYREFQPPPPGQEPPKKKGEPEVCPECAGIGYRGRIAIFELLLVDDGIRQILAKQPKLESLRQAARKAGNRTLQEEGVLLVANGVTSLAELQRVLKE